MSASAPTVGGYAIIDEPAPTRLEALALHPALILFACMFVPPPYLYLIPLWSLLNGRALGSRTLLRELAAIALFAGFATALPFGLSLLMHEGWLPYTVAQVSPYVRVLYNGAFFALMYRLMLLQLPAYEIGEYVREGRERSGP